MSLAFLVDRLVGKEIMGPIPRGVVLRELVGAKAFTNIAQSRRIINGRGVLFMNSHELDLLVHPTSEIFGTVKAAPSKSYTHRAIIIGSMMGETRITNSLACQDTRRTVATWEKMGAKVTQEKDDLVIHGFEGKPYLNGDRVLDVGESGTLLRFVLPILALGQGQYTVTGNGSLKDRPNSEIIEILKGWGVDIHGEGIKHSIPIKINAKGELKGGEIHLSGATSSQVVSSLLIAAPLAKEDTTLHLSDDLVSRPYIDITIDVLRWAGIKVNRDGYRKFTVSKGQQYEPRHEYRIHGDYSSAAFILAAACLIKSDIVITDLVDDDRQGDKAIVGILRRMGANLSHQNGEIRLRGPCALHGIEIDCRDTPDLGPILTTLGCFAKGKTRIFNIAHLKHKESNRILEPAGQLQKLGASIVTHESGEIEITESVLHGGTVSSCNDHRIAMALAVAALRASGDVLIHGASCIDKSYPDFVKDMASLGVKIEQLEKVPHVGV